MKAYCVKYQMYETDCQVQFVTFLAKNKEDAYYKAVTEIIPNMNDGREPFYAYVHSVTYQNGNCKYLKRD